MPSWRDTASQLTQDDLDGLLNVVLPFAQKMLEEHGEFYPFAAAITTDGQLELVAGDPDPGIEHPAARDIVVTCFDALVSRRDQIRAAAVVTNVRLHDTGGDAIAIHTEHVEGQVISARLPYSLPRLFRRRVSYGALQAGPAERRIWPSL
jgi:hypothetical protein